ncbi:UDP-N-acetylmuramoyl-L-alanine--D-glutamate ligase [Herminiimonas sp. CN]|uniref:UDP-N-acetylmuramoyl-L-alanine--D-glutamate ligase n=1 Tax=Herminiimonas sp. CN TaxID=1349818 RepID=UPI00047329B0|nr:UDP-N-acetylmuramoyl-L-alanine--D-glutamate ligase [Herminiimonas sp. CN]
MNYDGKHVLVLGLGESGLAMAQWLHRCGALLRVADTRAAPQRLSALREILPTVEFIGGSTFSANLLAGIDVVAVSPGLSPQGELSEIMPAAQAREIPVWGEIEFFAQGLAQLQQDKSYAPKLIAITGTNGKTTVTSMVGLLCKRAGWSTCVAGNISPSALDVLRETIERDDLPQVWVLELSSFQLHTTCSLQADAATVLNITQDHLDWHGSMAAYVSDKARIFGADTVRVLNRDDAAVMGLASAQAPTITFGADAPTQAGDFGLLDERGVQWLSVAVAAEEEEKRRKKNHSTALPAVVSRLMPTDALNIRGQHNALNALAALALCRAIGLPLSSLLHGLREYRGEPHRVELIATIGAVKYYDDSKGTNVGATVAALNGLGSQQGSHRLVLIAGGDGKGQDFSSLAEPVAKHVRAVFLIGKDAPILRSALSATAIDLCDCASLDDAVQRAAVVAQPGDAVLLSPACASLDMFANYAHRAQVFVDAVREIGLSRGEVIA